MPLWLVVVLFFVLTVVIPFGIAFLQEAKSPHNGRDRPAK
jgi:hypothetical protein